MPLELAPSDLHTYAHGVWGTTPVYGVQVIGLLDIVDRDASSSTSYPTWEMQEFPAIPKTDQAAAARRIFGIPDAMSMTIMGAEIPSAIEAAGILGFRHDPVLEPVSGYGL